MCYTYYMDIKEISERFGLEFILLFGSRACGAETGESDLDIAVYGSHILSEDEKMNLIYELSHIFKSEDIDLVDIKNAPPLLRKKIFDNYRVIYLRSPFLLYQVELASLYEYNEARLLYEIRRERLKEFIND
ncbi:MAG: nucleotidyltransferase domain-containing protein [Nitrospirae bacterium]|nr:MAG: nucleotidyltransferase domain-containing protein [Nitrospirota bacterium]